MRKRVVREAEEGGEGPSVSTALVRGLAVLRAFRPGDEWLGNQEIAARTGLPKATVSRLALTLSTLGYLDYNADFGRYSLGNATVSLGYSALSANAVIRLARPLMQALAEETGAAVALGARDNLDMVYLSNCRSESLVTLRLNPGSHVPIWRTSMGLAYLAGLPADEREALAARLRAAEPEHAEAIEQAVGSALEQHAGRGYIVSVGKWHSYIRAVGVPFVPTDGSQTVAITCGGTAEIIRDEDIHTRIGPALVALTADLASALGQAQPRDSCGPRTGVVPAMPKRPVRG